MIDADDLRMIREAADRLFAEHCDRTVLTAAAGGIWPAALWDEIEAAGLARALISEERGGAGLPLFDGLALAGIAAEHAAPIPFAETLIAGWLLDRAGLDVPNGPLVPVMAKQAAHVPWGGRAGLVWIENDRLFLIGQGGARVHAGTNLAGEPRDRIEVDLSGAPSVPSPVDESGLEAVLAGIRAIQIAGAIARITDLAATYARDRVQFGKPIARFQAIQQQLAVLATQAAVASAAADLARGAIASGDLLPACAIAKARAGEAAGAGAAIAHQVHGAIGFTLDHDLQFWTKRLWSWRDEQGNESIWNLQAGRALLAVGGDGLWPAITVI